MTTLLALTAMAGAVQAANIDDYVQTQLHDATFVARVIKADQSKLKKINHDFGTSYRFDSTTIKVKEPFMIWGEAKVEDTRILFVENGAHKMIKGGPFKSKQNTSNKPGQRQTIFDFGILTPSLFQDLYQAKFVRNDRETGDAVFDVTYIDTHDDTSRSRIWVNKAHRIIDKREWYNQSGRQLATFFYENPEEIDGVWMPTKCEVRNVDNVVAGVTAYESIKVNTGIPDSVFSVG